jgi:hypothetical protein
MQPAKLIIRARSPPSVRQPRSYPIIFSRQQTIAEVFARILYSRQTIYEYESKKSPGSLNGRGLSLTTVRHLKSPVSPSPQPCNAAFGSAAFGPPVSLYRSKFSDCPADAVPNSYPKLDLLWDNVIAGYTQPQRT